MNNRINDFSIGFPAAPIDIVKKTLSVPHLGVFGTWNAFKYCDVGTAVYAFRLNVSDMKF